MEIKKASFLPQSKSCITWKWARISIFRVLSQSRERLLCDNILRYQSNNNNKRKKELLELTLFPCVRPSVHMLIALLFYLISSVHQPFSSCMLSPDTPPLFTWWCKHPPQITEKYHNGDSTEMYQPHLSNVMSMVKNWLFFFFFFWNMSAWDF